jgi:hypothetical protein
MEEIIVEGLNYEDFVDLKEILSNNTNFSAKERNLYNSNCNLIERIDQILQAFEE